MILSQEEQQGFYFESHFYQYPDLEAIGSPKVWVRKQASGYSLIPTWDRAGVGTPRYRVIIFYFQR